MPQFVKRELSKRWCVYGNPKNFASGQGYCYYYSGFLSDRCDARQYCSYASTLEECVKEFLAEMDGGLNRCALFLPTEDFIRAREEVNRNERAKES